MSQPEGRKTQQDDSDHRAEPLSAGIGLLDDHHPGQQRHRHQASHANPKHDQHQRPAAAQAERAVAQAQVPGCSYPLAIVTHEEAERAAALLETASLERAELEDYPRARRWSRQSPRYGCRARTSDARASGSGYLPETPRARTPSRRRHSLPGTHLGPHVGVSVAGQHARSYRPSACSRAASSLPS